MFRKLFLFAIILILFSSITSVKAQSNLHLLKEESSNIHKIDEENSNVYTLYKDYLNIYSSPFYNEPVYNNADYKKRKGLIVIKDSTNKITSVIYLNDNTQKELTNRSNKKIKVSE